MGTINSIKLKVQIGEVLSESEATELVEFIELMNVGGFEGAVRPLMKWMNDNYHPHCTAIVTPIRAELLQGLEATKKIFDYVKD